MDLRWISLVLFLSPLLTSAGERFTFAAFGCLPYGQDSYEDFERVLAEVDRRAPAFAVHLGDIKGGGDVPTMEHYLRVRDSFNAMTTPLVYTPGDNEWTDVHRESNDRHDPLEWLQKVREIFFTDEMSHGKFPMPVVSQRRDPRFAKFVENAWWAREGVFFATVHAVGSSNNDQPSVPGAVEEFMERDAANTQWIRNVFAMAEKNDAPGVVLFFQVDPFAADFGRTGYDRGHENFLRTLEAEAREFTKPVLLVHADDHNYRLDHGISFVPGGEPVPNVTRLCTFGDKSRHAVIVVVDPARPGLFLCGPLLVPGNALPAVIQ